MGWANPRQFASDVWLGALALETSEARRDSRHWHVPQGKETIRPADIVAIEVINRLCSPCSEFARWQSTGMRRLAWRTFWVFPIAAMSPRIACIEPSISCSELKRRSSRDLEETIGHVVSTRLQPGTLRPHEYLLRGIGGRKRAGPARILLAITVATASRLSWPWS